MNSDVKAKWLEALRSGDYGQTTGVLRSTVEGADGNETVGYCCLGVLCDVAVKNGVIEAPTQVDGSDVWAYPDGAMQQTHILPAAVAAWAGLNDDNPSVSAEVLMYDEESGEDIPCLMTDGIATFNDDYDCTFEQLADLIEQQL